MGEDERSLHRQCASGLGSMSSSTARTRSQ
jgi:hypothetical protein